MEGNTWVYGYANITGLLMIKEDPINLSVDLFYDPLVKKELSDSKETDLWALSNKSRDPQEIKQDGIVFKCYVPDESLEKIKTLMETDKKGALKMLNEKSIHIELGTQSITNQTAINRWYKICEIQQPVPQHVDSNEVE